MGLFCMEFEMGCVDWGTWEWFLYCCIHLRVPFIYFVIEEKSCERNNIIK